ncbi:MAG: hypothetical protein PHE29_06060 [Tissierellia bacterium]|nr:hypothetical protein [Tissierellia bacterium]MDD4781565.1 hypothetical protein [Tissierellia bacterium]
MDFNEVESFLTNIKSVISCKIIADEDGAIIEVHILADNSRHTKQIARDIRSTLITKFNILVDYKLISVAQLTQNLTTNTSYRLAYDGYSNETTNDYIKLCVKLSCDDNEFSGESQGIKSEKNILKIAAAATIDAVKNAIGLDCFLIEDIQTSKIAGQEVVITAITQIKQGEECILTGSSIVVNNKIDAVIKSTLNAINRKVCLLI